MRSRFLTEAEAAELLRRFREGGLRVPDEIAPAAPEDAIAETDGAHLSAALAALFAFLAVDSIARLSRLPRPRVARSHELLFDAFGDRAARLASAVSATRNVSRFHADAVDLVRLSTLEQASLGAGRRLLPSELSALDSRLRVQLAYLSRFADRLALGFVEGSPLSPMSEAAIRARLVLYRGEVRAAFYAAQEFDTPEGYVADYVAVDDGGTCGPCHSAGARSPYLPGDPDSPYPGRVCRGRGRCRCRRELRYAPDEAARLRP